MDLKELEDKIREKCKLIHAQTDKRLDGHDEELTCLLKKILERAKEGDLSQLRIKISREMEEIKKAYKAEDLVLSNRINKIDNRQWAMLIGAWVASLSSIITLLVVLFNQSGG